MTASEYPGSPSLYPILDLDFCNKNGILPDSLIKIWSQETLTVPFIQVRAKSLNVKDFTAFYRQLKEQNPDARLIVNDHWEVAIKENAFGFHVGKEDFQFLPDEERKIIGSSPLFKGTSSHNLEDIKNLDSEIWNYSGIGPIFQTSTKVTKNKILGTQFLLDATKATRIPLIPIGGISAETIAEIFRFGIFLVASISAFSDKNQFEKAVSIANEFKNPDQKP